MTYYLLGEVTREVIEELDPVSSEVALSIYDQYLRSRSEELRHRNTGFWSWLNFWSDWVSPQPNPLNLQQIPLRHPALSPITSPADFFIRPIPDWAYAAAGVDRNFAQRSIEEYANILRRWQQIISPPPPPWMIRGVPPAGHF
jgi:hypothetical protein